MTATPPAATPLVFDRAILARRRDRAADAFERHDFLLQHVTDDIADRLAVVRRRFDVTLVLGAHHGIVGRRLRTLAAIGTVIEAESAPRLLARCDGPRVLADEEFLPFRDASLDLVISPLTLQHVNDVPGALAQIRRALKPDGLFLGAMLGGATLTELRQSFLLAEAGLEGGASPRVAPFADVRDAGALLLRAGFALPVADADALTVTYPTPFDLLRDLRAMGATNALLARRRTPLRRATLMRMAEIYAERFSTQDGRVKATFEIVSMTGWAPHESQQKPLAPGSAKTRLADALKVGKESDGSGA
jgi:NADH dehydrogenase [ubiquinone] 1 alpha subcomplex assembly factor 5